MVSVVNEAKEAYRDKGIVQHSGPSEEMAGRRNSGSQ